MISDLNWLDAGLLAIVAVVTVTGVWIGSIRVLLSWPMRLLLSYILALLTLITVAAASGRAFSALTDQLKAIDPILNTIVGLAVLLLLMIIWFKALGWIRGKLLFMRDRYASGPIADRIAGFPVGLFVGLIALFCVAWPMMFYRQFTASTASTSPAIQQSRLLRDVDRNLGWLMPRVPKVVPQPR